MSEFESKPLSPAQREFVEKQIMGILTTVRKDGLLSANPVSFYMDDSGIRISTLKSRMKYKNVQNDPRVVFCLWSFDNPMHYIELRGNATLEDDPDKALFKKQFQRGMGGELPPEDLDGPDEERVVIRLHISQISSPVIYGGRFDEINQKSE